MVAITFDEARHEYRADGIIVPSVSAIIAQINDLGRVPPHILRAAAKRGTDVHAACEYWDDGDLDETSLTDEIHGYLVGWMEWRNRTKSTVRRSESTVYHPVLRYCGTLDRLMNIDGRTALIDIKTTAQQHESHGVQLAGYKMALKANGIEVDRSACVYLSRDGEATEVDYSSQHYEGVFLACLTLYNWRIKHEQA